MFGRSADNTSPIDRLRKANASVSVSFFTIIFPFGSLDFFVGRKLSATLWKLQAFVS